MSKHPSRSRRGAPRTSHTSTPVRPLAALVASSALQDEVDASRRLLAHLQHAPDLARVVPHLAPETLQGMIRHGGLDACGAVLAAATPAQLASVFDIDVWRSAQPGLDEHFDADRFGEWLEVLVDEGAPVAARVIAAMDEEVVAVGLARYVRVFDPSALGPSTPIDDDPMEMEPTPPTGPEGLVGGYLVRAIRPDGWDAIIALLGALAAEHAATFEAVMRGCRRLSNSAPEIDGLDNLLTEPEQQLHDMALEREERRSQRGYSTPADARAFLQMARQPKLEPPDRSSSTNPIAAAYFRAADDAASATDASAMRPPSRALPAGPSGDTAPAARHAAPDALPADLTPLQVLMAHVQDEDDAMYVARSRELAFLVNTLISGCSIQSRAFTPQEASAAVAGVCDLGLALWPARWSRRDRDTFLVDHDLVSVFEVGWAALYEGVSMYVAKRLIATLAALQCTDAETQDGLDTLRQELVRHHAAGTPWRAREALDVIAGLDPPAWASLLGLLDECPVLPLALRAILQGHTGGVSATEFEFISSPDQVRDVQSFMERLLDVLAPTV